MPEYDFRKTLTNHCIFLKKYACGNFIVLLLHVDDRIKVRHDPKKIFAVKKTLSKSFSMKDLGSTKNILGMKITRGKSKKLLWLS